MLALLFLKWHVNHGHQESIGDKWIENFHLGHILGKKTKILSIENGHPILLLHGLIISLTCKV